VWWKSPLVPLVAAHLETLHGHPNPLDLVFPSEAGTPLYPKNVRRRHFVPAMQALGVFHYYHRWRTISRWPWTALRSARDNHLSKARWSPSRQWVDSIATMSGWRGVIFCGWELRRIARYAFSGRTGGTASPPWWPSCANTCWAGKHTFAWPIRQGSSPPSTSGFAVGRAWSTSSSGSEVRPPSVSYGLGASPSA
jgi:hypothetical protein